MGYLPRHGSNLEVVKSADEAALDVLFVKLGEAGKHWQIIPQWGRRWNAGIIKHLQTQNSSSQNLDAEKRQV